MAATEVLLETWLPGRLAFVPARCWTRGLVNESSFSYAYFEGQRLRHGDVLRRVQRPLVALAPAILEEVSASSVEGIPAEAFERLKRALYGELVAALNSTGSIANGLVNTCT